MIIRLSESIWWGDRRAIEEHPELPIRFVLNVADNLSANYWPRIGKLPQSVPYFRLSRSDHNPIDIAWICDLDSVFDLVSRNKLLPMLVHCMAGVHRSTATAIYMQWRLQNRIGLDGIRDRMRNLLPQVEETGIYHSSLMAYCAGWPK